MSKGLEALERLSTVASMYCDECATSEEDLDSGMFEKDYQAVKTIEKELKALDIIKKHWNFEYLKFGFGSKGLVQIKPISMEDADLLSEVLL